MNRFTVYEFNSYYQISYGPTHTILPSGLTHTHYNYWYVDKKDLDDLIDTLKELRESDGD